MDTTIQREKLEQATATSRGYVGLEDEVLVTADGAQWLSPAQRELIYVE